MTNSEKRAQLSICAYKKNRIVARIINTKKEIEDARLWYEVYMSRVNRLEKRLARQQAELRRQGRIEQAIIDDVDEYDEFYLLANEMTA